MTIRLRYLAKIFSTIIFFYFFTAASNAANPVSQVMVINTDDLPSYLKEMEVGKAILKKMDSTRKLRVWRATHAGTDVGTVVATAEWPDFEAYAADIVKTGNNEEWLEWVNKLSTMRSFDSFSFYHELKSE